VAPRLQKSPVTVSHLRIIGGEWRSRKLPFAASAGVRPTPDRVRETAFNWLQPVIAGARCLDLFAGSGAFGFEAVSRGAAAAILVEEDLRVVQTLQKNVELLQTDNVHVQWMDARQFLATSREKPFDIVFLDPPYRDDINDWARRLADSPLLGASAWIYVEASSRTTLQLPPGWELQRSKHAGDVGYHLARRRDSAA